MRKRITNRKFRMLGALCLIALLSLSGCRKEAFENDPEPPATAGEVVLRFKHDAKQATRSALNGVYVDYKTVQDVWILVFSGHGSDATFLFRDNIDWQGDISQSHRLSRVLEAGPYTLLAVGVDDKAGATYQLPQEIAVGTPLKNAQASLASGAGAQDMARSDFYAAQAKIEVGSDVGIAVEMTLRRRNSGVVAYLKNIPYEINYDRVEKVFVRLCDDQRTSLRLYDNTDDEWTEEWEDQWWEYMYGFGALSDSRVLMEFDMTSYSKSPDGNFFAIPAGDNPKTLENTLYGGVFLLPIENNTPSNNTLQIELYGGGATGILPGTLKTYTVQLGTSTSYAIESNHLYSIGKKITAESTVGDDPTDISGNRIEIHVRDYDLDYIGDINFPTVSQPAYINPPFNSEKYIFDCISTIDSIYIDASYPSYPWKLTIPEEVDWLRFVDYDDQGKITGYTREVEGEGSAMVKFLLNDYLEERFTVDNGTILDPDAVNTIKNDYRTADLQLYTSTLGRTTTKPIRQYNAISVKYFDPDGQGRNLTFGINRLDFGCTFNRQTGEVDRSGVHRLGWGYFNTLIAYVFALSERIGCIDGEANFLEAKKRYQVGSSGSGGYISSMVERAATEATELDASNTNTSSGRYWTAPAYWQVGDINRLIVNLEKVSGTDVRSLMNFDPDPQQLYWSSSCLNDIASLAPIVYSAYALRMGDVSSENNTIKKSRYDEYPVRRCRRFE